MIRKVEGFPDKIRSKIETAILGEPHERSTAGATQRQADE
jgi:hypothetical protein